jgi:hypothetical protein
MITFYSGAKGGGKERISINKINKYDELVKEIREAKTENDKNAAWADLGKLLHKEYNELKNPVNDPCDEWNMT